MWSNAQNLTGDTLLGRLKNNMCSPSSILVLDVQSSILFSVEWMFYLNLNTLQSMP